MSFSFGAPTAAAPSGGFSLGAAVSFGATPASHGNTNSTSAASTGANQPTAPSQPVLDVTIDERPLAAFQLWKQLSRCAALSLRPDSEAARWAGQELIQLLQQHQDELLRPALPTYEAPNLALRERLQQCPLIQLTTGGPPIHLSPSNHTLPLLWAVANDLRVSEAHAISLYAQARQPEVRRRIGSDGDDSATVQAVATALYFQQYQWPLQSLLMLLQYRLSEGAAAYLVPATDRLIQAGVVDHLVQYMKDTTRRIQQWGQEVAQFEATSSSMSLSSSSSPSPSPPSSSSSSSSSFAQVHLDFWMEQRQRAAEILFFLAYHVQWHGPEVAHLIDLIRTLSNELREWDPLSDIPSVYHSSEPNASTSVTLASTTYYPWSTTTPSMTTIIKKEKTPLEWQRELVHDVFQTGQPQLLRCVGTLVVACLSALETKEVLMDRHTHRPNEFGAVRKAGLFVDHVCILLGKQQ